MDNSQPKEFVVEGAVKKSYPDSVEARLMTICESRGEKWSEVYKDLGWSKSFASIVRRGLLIPPEWQRIILAKRLEVDTSVIWKIPEIVSADKVKEDKNVVET